MPSVVWQRAVAADGWHNALPTCGSGAACTGWSTGAPPTHASGDGAVVVMRSVDLQRRQQLGLIGTGYADRDPKIIAVSDRLYIYFGTLSRASTLTDWPDGPVLTHLSNSANGTGWSEPTPVYDPSWWLWRVRHHGGHFPSPAYTFGAGERFADPRPEPAMDLLESHDGVAWTRRGGISRLGRSGNRGRPAVPARSRALLHRPRRMHAGDLLLLPLAGTVRALEGIDQSEMLVDEQGRHRHLPAGSTGIWRVERGAVTPFLAVASPGDCADPGLVPLGRSRLLLSYYSQDAARSGVDPPRAPLRLPPQIAHLQDKCVADVYVPEIELD